MKMQLISQRKSSPTIGGGVQKERGKQNTSNVKKLMTLTWGKRQEWVRLNVPLFLVL